MLRAFLVTFCSSVLLACGGPTTPDANTPEDGVPTDDAPVDTDTPTTDDGPTEDGKPAPGGIVRDADGDGIPDDKEVSACGDKNETQCKINMECAWSEEGKCVKAKAGM